MEIACAAGSIELLERDSARSVEPILSPTSIRAHRDKSAMASAQGHAAMEAYWRDDFAPLEAAGKAVLEALREDEAAPDADLYRRVVSSGSGSHLYFVDNATGATMQHTKSVPLPPFLSQQLETTRQSSLMGLLPEGELVWMSVDEKLYLWSSNTSTVPGGMEDFCSFTVPTGQSIVSVGMVKPRKGESFRY